MIAVIRTINGTYNILGTKENAFIITGNLTLDELLELRDEINIALKEARKE
jgi:hypothetical protein